MLSAEELRLWDHVRSTKFDQLVGTNQRTARTRPLLEDDLVAATAVLTEWTAAVEEQSDLLPRHWERQPLDTPKYLPRGPERTVRHLSGQLGRKDALGLQQLRLTLGEEADALTSSFQSALEEAWQTKKATQRRLVQLLHDDDRRLDALQKLAPSYESVTGCEVSSNRKASRLASRLVDFTCEQTQCRLEQIYLEHLCEHETQEDEREADPSNHQVSLRSDVNSLYAEIRDVVAMSVSHEFLYPLRSSQQEKWGQQSEYMLRTLLRSRKSLEDAAGALVTFDSYAASLEVFRANYHSENANIELSPGCGSFLTSVENGRTKDAAALSALLLHTGISTDGPVDSRSLEHDLSSKVTKLHGSTSYKAPSADKSTIDILNINDASSQLLSTALPGHVETPSTVTFDTSLGALDNKIAVLKGKVEDVDLSKVMKSSKTQKHFLERWA